MPNERCLPIRYFSERVYGRFINFKEYRRHIEPLDLKAKGDVLIIGPSPFGEELIAIEPAIAEGQVKSLTLLGAADMYYGAFKTSYDTPITVSGTSYGAFFDGATREGQPQQKFDTILDLGTFLNHPVETIKDLAEQLAPLGCLFMTVNGRLPRQTLEITDCQVRIIPNIPLNPNYPYPPGYYGVAVEKRQS